MFSATNAGAMIFGDVQGRADEVVHVRIAAVSLVISPCVSPSSLRYSICSAVKVLSMICNSQPSLKDVTRMNIIEKFTTEVKLTKASARTYYQTIKNKHEPLGKKVISIS